MSFPWPKTVPTRGWTGLGGALIFLAGVGQPAFGADAASSIRLDFNSGWVSIEANNADLLQVLTLLGNKADFVVEPRRWEAPSPRVTGNTAGRLDEALRWLLQGQNYVLLYVVRPAGASASNDRPPPLARLILAGSPSSLADLPSSGTASTPNASEKLLHPVAEDPAALARLINFSPAQQPEPAMPTQRAVEESVSASAALPAQTPEQLTPSGAQLSTVLVDPHWTEISRAVDLAGDLPLATYVMTHGTGGASLQRTTFGTWIPWDGRETSLIDNRFVASDGRLTFEVWNGNLSDELFPVTFTLAYRTSDDLKFGVFEVMPWQPE